MASGAVPTIHFRKGLLARSKRLGRAARIGHHHEAKTFLLRKRRAGHVFVIRGEGIPFPTAATNVRELRGAATPWVQRF